MIAADRIIVEVALDSEQGISGRRYLEKIVQVGFDIPSIDTIKITQYLTSELDQILEENPDVPFDQEYWHEVPLYRISLLLQLPRRKTLHQFSGVQFQYRDRGGQWSRLHRYGSYPVVSMPEVYSEIARNRILFTQAYEREDRSILGAFNCPGRF